MSIVRFGYPPNKILNCLGRPWSKVTTAISESVEVSITRIVRLHSHPIRWIKIRKVVILISSKIVNPLAVQFLHFIIFWGIVLLLFGRAVAGRCVSTVCPRWRIFGNYFRTIDKFNVVGFPIKIFRPCELVMWVVIRPERILVWANAQGMISVG